MVNGDQEDNDDQVGNEDQEGDVIIRPLRDPGIPGFFQNPNPGILKNLIPGFFGISRSP